KTEPGDTDEGHVGSARLRLSIARTLRLDDERSRQTSRRRRFGAPRERRHAGQGGEGDRYWQTRANDSGGTLTDRKKPSRLPALDEPRGSERPSDGRRAEQRRLERRRKDRPRERQSDPERNGRRHDPREDPHQSGQHGNGQEA